MVPKNFAITGVAGYVAPRHLEAIRETGNQLVAAMDPHDSVGILDQFSYEVKYFKEFERFDRYLEKRRRLEENDRVHFVSICAPNYLHDAHIRTALRIGADVICEKPLVLNPWNLDALQDLELETQRRVYTVLQLRLHPSIWMLKKRISEDKPPTKYEIELTYVTARGNWYQRSWKGHPEQSGGIAANIGIHFFDALIWIFGPVKLIEVYLAETNKMAGFLELEKARVQWFLSIDSSDLRAVDPTSTTYRSLRCNGEEIEFSDGFSGLHTEVYRKILEGNGLGIEEARPSIQLVYDIRQTKLKQSGTTSHSFLSRPLSR